MSKQLLPKAEQQVKEYQGEPLPAQLAYGPLEERGCRDIFFCLLFILFWAGLIIIAGIALKSGDPARLASPFDSNGNQCGYGLAAHYPVMFFSGMGQVISSNLYACVKECPTTSSLHVECLVNKSVPDCSDLQLYNSITFITVCLPTSTALTDSIQSKINIGSLDQWMSDIKTTWPISLCVAVISLFVSLFFLFLMKSCAGFITWVMIAGYFGALISLGVLCLQKAKTGNFDSVPKNLSNQNALEVIAYILLVTAGLSFLLFICFFSKIRKAIAIMKAASDFTRDVWQAIVIPMIMFLMIAAFFTFWIIISLYIFSSGEVVQSSSSPFGSVNWNVGVKRCLFYYLFGLFWNIEFIIGMNQLIIASCAGMWYFSHRQASHLESPVSKSICRAFTYHVGSVCLGSLVLSVVMILKVMMEAMYRQMKKNLNSNPAATCLMKCCLCCVRCFETFIRFINTNAYIMIGLTGNSFCGAAKDAFFLILRNAAQFSITHGIGKIFVFFGKLFICSFSAMMGYFIINNVDAYSSKIYSSGAPTLLFVIISFCISSVFMNIYGMAADTLLLCLCSDKEINNGKAHSCPKAIQQFEEQHMN